MADQAAATTVVATGTINTTGSTEPVAAAVAATNPATAPAIAPTSADQAAAAARFAALSRQEKSQRLQAKQLADERKALDTARATMEADVRAKYIDPVEFKKNPYKYLKDNGLTLEQVAEIALNDGVPTPSSLVNDATKELKAEIAEMRKQLAAKDTAEQEAQYERVEQSFKADLNKFVADTPDYEMIRANEAGPLVFEVIDTHFNTQLEAYVEEHGAEPDAATRASFIMSNKDACDKVENYLLEEAKKYVALPKIKGLMAPPAIQAPSSKASTTLTNADAATAIPTSSKMLSDDESKRAAAQLIKWDA